MADSLRDQLRALGLVKKPEPKPERPAHPPGGARKPQGRGGKPNAPGGKPGGSHHKQAAAAAPSSEPDLAQAYAARARAERAERERAEREAQERARDRRERRTRLAALVEGKALNIADADVPRHFEQGGKIRRVYVTAEQLLQVNRGELGVVQKDGRYLLVVREVALAAQALLPESVLLLVDPDAVPEDDVPPDLIW
jgi:uncharacterized protein YaiL (DUF2058 family)